MTATVTDILCFRESIERAIGRELHTVIQAANRHDYRSMEMLVKGLNELLHQRSGITELVRSMEAKERLKK